MSPIVPEGLPTAAPCDCESCRIVDAFRQAEPHLTNAAAQRVAFTTYWSITCYRCGDRVAFSGLAEQVMCDPCEAETEGEHP